MKELINTLSGFGCLGVILAFLICIAALSIEAFIFMLCLNILLPLFGMVDFHMEFWHAILFSLCINFITSLLKSNK